MYLAEELQVFSNRVHLREFRGALSNQIETNFAGFLRRRKDLLPGHLALAQQGRLSIHRGAVRGQNAIVPAGILVDESHGVGVLAAGANVGLEVEIRRAGEDIYGPLSLHGLKLYRVVVEGAAL